MYTTAEVLKFVQENDVKFVRLTFCDIFGLQKNVSIMADQLEAAFAEGVGFDAYAVSGFREVTESDLFLFPDPSTLTVLPWRPGSGRVARFYCDIKTPDGSEFINDGRCLLKRVVKRAEDLGYIFQIGTECEFYLFKADENGQPTGETLDNGGYLDISPLDRGEDVRREICLALEQMGINPKGSYHEQGPGQNEIDCRYSEPLVCVDNFQIFKSAVKAVAARHGLFASFMPKPIPDAPGSGLRINISFTHNGQNVFGHANGGHAKAAEGFIAGVLAKIPEITLFLNPLANSYERLGKFEAPKYVSWSHQNRSQLIRIPADSGKNSRMELRSPDPSLNPYIALALILAAGLDGIENNLPLPPATNVNLFTADKSVTDTLTALPESLSQAIVLAQASEFVKGIIGEELLCKFIDAKQKEAAEFVAATNKIEFYKARYFAVT
ncbi:MAG: glutamine synthetase family protein [Defluviitaleaceae bacterium]|nr:glutamine synthetase family protein [Defluviitaleaceae bacterium]